MRPSLGTKSKIVTLLYFGCVIGVILLPPSIFSNGVLALAQGVSEFVGKEQFIEKNVDFKPVAHMVIFASFLFYPILLIIILLENWKPSEEMLTKHMSKDEGTIGGYAVFMVVMAVLIPYLLPGNPDQAGPWGRISRGVVNSEFGFCFGVVLIQMASIGGWMVAMQLLMTIVEKRKRIAG